ncbi:hypothetical protein [Streptomyces anulatus]|uniref:hypothetical protein n=1 Tax=Streptomyces anulatus TaxID=1892 RepID=UPI0033CDA6F1
MLDFISGFVGDIVEAMVRGGLRLRRRRRLRKGKPVTLPCAFRDPAVHHSLRDGRLRIAPDLVQWSPKDSGNHAGERRIFRPGDCRRTAVPERMVAVGRDRERTFAAATLSTPAGDFEIAVEREMLPLVVERLAQHRGARAWM